MSTQQDIYAAGSESRPPMLNKENYVPWSSRLLRELGVMVVSSSLTILLGLPEDIYAAIDSCETAQEIWLRVQQIMKGSNIGIQEKKANLFNEWERFTSNEGESIESYYHLFLKLMNDLKRNKHFPEKIASNLKFLNNLQPEWSRHVTIVHQTKDLHTADYTQLSHNCNEYGTRINGKSIQAKPLNTNQQQSKNFIKPKEQVDCSTENEYGSRHTNTDGWRNQVTQNAVQNLRVQNNNNDVISEDTSVEQGGETVEQHPANFEETRSISSNPRNRQIAQSGMNIGQDRQMQMVGGNGGNQFRQNAGNPAGDAAYLQTQLLIAQKEEAGIQLQAEEYDLIAATADLDEIKDVNANCILMANLQQASTSGTQTDSAPVYDTDGSAEVHENCDDNEIFNMFTQEEQYTELLEPIPESHQVPQNNNDVISEDTSVEQGVETVEQHPANF
nr:hypothetical protein [Tanacetum cinerariifolium]